MSLLAALCLISADFPLIIDANAFALLQRPGVQVERVIVERHYPAIGEVLVRRPDGSRWFIATDHCRPGRVTWVISVPRMFGGIGSRLLLANGDSFKVWNAERAR